MNIRTDSEYKRCSMGSQQAEVYRAIGFPLAAPLQTLRFRLVSLHTLACLVTAFMFLLPSPSAFAETHFTLLLQGNFEFKDAGFHEAQNKHFYTNHNIDVTFIPSSQAELKDEQIKRVISGEIDFGVADVELLKAYAENASIVAYATLFQLTDITLYTRENILISSPRDLAKLRIATPPGTRYELPLLYILSRAGSPVIPEYKVSANPLLDLKNDDVDVILGSSLTLPYEAERQNIQLEVIPFEKFGLDLPGPTIFSSKAVFERNRDAAYQFVLASLEGWEYALNNADEAALSLTRRRMALGGDNPIYGIDFFQAEQTRRLAMFPVVAPGHISSQRWEKNFNRLMPVLETDRTFDENFVDNPVERMQSQAEQLSNLLKYGIPTLLLILIGISIHSIQRIVSRKKYERSLYQQATTDSLTGLPNRKLAFEYLENWINNNRSASTTFSVMFLDLDGFKAVNDMVSHNMGDALLIQVAQRLSAVCDENELLARIGGDEFLVLTTKTTNAELSTLSSDMLAAIKRTFQIEGYEFILGVSIGVARYPEHGSSSQELLSNSDAAMYSAKDDGKNKQCIYTDALGAIAREKADIATKLVSAIKLQELCLRYQPIVDMKDGSFVGAEALVRWNNSQLGELGPDKFIPIAEEFGSIMEIGEWVMKTALTDMQRWNEVASQPVYVSVNVSPRQFISPMFVENTLHSIRKSGAPHNLLKLEITENLFVGDNQRIAGVLDRLDQSGVKVFLDDFGTGYSSLSYLKSFPFSVVKIDQSFIREINNDVKNISLVKAIVELAKGLDMKVVSEGVETNEQANQLLNLNCQYGQGYLFGKPLRFEELRHAISEPPALKLAS